MKGKHRRTVYIATIISFAMGSAALFIYFFPSNPSGALIYFLYFTLLHVLFWLRMPPPADFVSWFRKLRNLMKRLGRKP